MSAWRRKAIALFPEQRAKLNRAEYELSDLFLDLTEDAAAAHARFGAAPADAAAAFVLRRVHGYAEWCMREGGELWRHAAVGFYESLFDRADWEYIAPWLSSFAVEQIEATWALGVGKEELPRFERVLRERRERLWLTHVYATGEIQSL